MDDSNLPPQPPAIAPVPLVVLFADSPNTIILTYARLLSLAWRAHYRETPPMPDEQLWAITQLSRSQFYSQLQTLEALGWVRKRRPRPGRLALIFPPLQVQESGLPDLVKLSESIVNKDIDSLALTESENLENQTAAAALEVLGVHPTIATYYAGLVPHETLATYRALYAWLKIHGKDKRRPNNAGWLARAIKEEWPIPDDFLGRCPECEHPPGDHELDCPAYAAAFRQANAEFTGATYELEHDPAAAELWLAAIAKARISMTPEMHHELKLRGYLQASAGLSVADGVLTVGAVNEYGRGWLERDFTLRIVPALIDVSGGEVQQVSFIIEPGITRLHIADREAICPK